MMANEGPEGRRKRAGRQGGRGTADEYIGRGAEREEKAFQRTITALVMDMNLPGPGSSYTEMKK